MHKYIHIGYPKNLSTALQRNFFEKHPQLMHLGVGCGSNVDYITDDVSLVFEHYITYARTLPYKKKRDILKKVIDNTLNKALINPEFKAVGISLELLSFSFTTDYVDTIEKAERLYDLFNGDAQIIIIIRNQIDLLKSLYKESIKLGYSGTYADYIEYAFLFQDRNFATDFCYDDVYDIYSNLFGRENIHVYPIEMMRNKDGSLRTLDSGEVLLFKKINEIFDCDYHDFDKDFYNESMSLNVLEAKRLLNKKYQHDLGNELWSKSTNFHRVKNYYSRIQGVSLSKDFIYADVKMKRKLIDIAESTPISIEPDEFFECNIGYLKELNSMYVNSNFKLQKNLDFFLPDTYFKDALL